MRLRLLGLTFSLLFVVTLGQRICADDPKPALLLQRAGEGQEKTEGEVDRYAPPAGTDREELLAFIQATTRMAPPVRTVQGLVEHYQKIDVVLVEIAGRDVDAEVQTQVATLRGTRLLPTMIRFGNKEAAERLTQLIADLQASEQVPLQKLGARLALTNRVQNAQSLEPAEQQALIDEVAGLIANFSEGEESELSQYLQFAQMLARVKEADPAAAIETYEQFLAVIKQRPEESAQTLVQRFEGIIRRLGLLGNPIEVVGSTVNGEAFDIAQLKGKVVLVDFWATWCGPCIGEIPNMKEMYTAYHDKGFEIVGISLDRDFDKLTTFIEEREIPWVILYDQENTRGWDNRTAVYYGINSIPAMVLVDQSGKVVNLKARGQALTEALAELLGPIEPAEANEEKAETTSKEPAAPAPAATGASS